MTGNVPALAQQCRRLFSCPPTRHRANINAGDFRSDRRPTHNGFGLALWARCGLCCGFLYAKSVTYPIPQRYNGENRRPTYVRAYVRARVVCLSISLLCRCRNRQGIETNKKNPQRRPQRLCISPVVPVVDLVPVSAKHLKSNKKGGKYVL